MDRPLSMLIVSRWLNWKFSILQNNQSFWFFPIWKFTHQNISRWKRRGDMCFSWLSLWLSGEWDTIYFRNISQKFNIRTDQCLWISSNFWFRRWEVRWWGPSLGTKSWRWYLLSYWCRTRINLRELRAIYFL